MLPFLPALILLLLQGPSNFERLAFEGQLPSALEALHRQIGYPGSERLSERDQAVLESLLAGGAENCLSNAFFAHFAANESLTSSACHEIEVSHASHVTYSATLTSGFGFFQRTRDGPSD